MRSKMTEEEHKKQSVKATRKWQKANPEKVSVLVKRYYEKHRDEILERNKKWRENNRDQSLAILRKYRTENKEKCLECSQKWRVEHPEKLKEAIENRKKNDPGHLKKWRHKKGISKHYTSDLGVSYTKEYKKAKRHERKMLFKKGGKLTTATVQLVYEDNIKRFGTLTCYLCLEFITFSKDHLEHKIPLSRGGTNEYSNLGIACQHCNCTKHNKTEEEFLQNAEANIIHR